VRVDERYQNRYNLLKRVEFLGSSRRALQAFPLDARREAGFQLDQVQRGREPKDWKPMPSVGAGVKEIRIREASGAFRVVVLHAFQKKSQRTAQADIDIAASRFRSLLSR
jgi:phage-related protein